ncbi:MAG TPA: helix-turn-helix domain-containing protein [Patescibacteria group bacterium]|nr:helix-turn-helix domain-containing protein [Patescibacteria group bacterium]
MPEEIKPNAIYTTAEAQSLLRVSNSTMKRLLKRGLLKANKVGRQYRILGKEILSLISPELENESAQIYLRAKKKVVDVINRWPN